MASDLAAELSSRASAHGPNVGLWPGMTIYRYVEPTVPKWDEIQSLSVCIVAQGRKKVTADGHHYVYDRYQYLVLRSNLHFQSQILDASPDEPFLAFVLQIDPAVVRKVSAEMLDPRDVSVRPAGPVESHDQSVVSKLDDELASAVLRFLTSRSPWDMRACRTSPRNFGFGLGRRRASMPMPGRDRVGMGRSRVEMR
jgi:hypothetical protein